MRSSAFIDEVVIHARAGDGGNGAVAWRREKFVPKGGPAGGDGGDGGDIRFIADESRSSLLDFRFKPHVTAKNGEPGRGKNQFGARGEDAIARVPVGTQIYDDETGVLLFDLTENGQEVVVCQGGSGGWGNTRFTNASRQAPDFSYPGRPGEEKQLRLSLKLLADVGLLGFPNAGKSTLLSQVSAARPKIASYPFTTLVPQLGVVRVSDGESFVMADIPGLIEGASEGAGLGIRFLKHLERVRVLCHLIEAPSDFAEESPLDRYVALRQELVNYSDELAALPEIVVLNKTDLMTEDALEHDAVIELKAHLDSIDVPLMTLSAATSDGVGPLVRALHTSAQKARLAAQAPDVDPGSYDPLRS